MAYLCKTCRNRYDCHTYAEKKRVGGCEYYEKEVFVEL